MQALLNAGSSCVANLTPWPAEPNTGIANQLTHDLPPMKTDFGVDSSDCRLPDNYLRGEVTLGKTATPVTDSAIRPHNAIYENLRTGDLDEFAYWRRCQKAPLLQVVRT